MFERLLENPVPRQPAAQQPPSYPPPYSIDAFNHGSRQHSFRYTTKMRSS